MKKAFTLIELLVVVLIIGILAAVALPMYTKSVEKSKVSEAIILSRSVYNAMVRYQLDSSTYVSTIDDLDIDIPASYQKSSDTIMTSKDFRFTLYPYAAYFYRQKPGITNYYAIAIYPEYASVPQEQEGKALCRFYTTEAEEICKYLTGNDTKVTIAGVDSFFAFKQ